jgi:hypothetical protein
MALLSDSGNKMGLPGDFVVGALVDQLIVRYLQLIIMMSPVT